MDELQAAKAIVQAANRDIDAAIPGDAPRAVARHVAGDYLWRGVHPFNEQLGADTVGETFWRPLKEAMGPLQRRPDIFLAGANQVDGWSTIWVAESGHFMGIWEQPWLGFAPAGKLAFLRYAEFHRVSDGRIAETACFVDILNMLAVSGHDIALENTGTELLAPGPRTHDGLLYNPQPPEEGRSTVELIAAMIADLRANSLCSPRGHLDRFWTSDMCWFGPGGIGASAFHHGYRRGHAEPFEEGLEFLGHTEHVARIGEGSFGGFFGYPSLTLRARGYLGLPESDTPAEMRIVDLYRRQGHKLAENWIFIDIPHFFAMQGHHLLPT